jgi:hypothetical protein
MVNATVDSNQVTPTAVNENPMRAFKAIFATKTSENLRVR